MNKVNYAAIDIGSNAVRLLIKSVNEEGSDELFTKELLLRVPLRLGQEVFTTGEISAVKEKKLIRLIKAFRQLMKIYEVTDYRACGTSAMRDARNSKEITRKIEKKTGIRIDVLTGKEEACLVYTNHIENLLDKDRNYIYVDVGGGSTEVIFISQGEMVSSQSYNIGTVRKLNGAVDEEEQNAMRRDIAAAAEKYPDPVIIGSGGNINKLFRLADHKDKKEVMLPVDVLRELYETLKKYEPGERRKLFRLKPDRAEVIVPAASIFLDVAEQSRSTLIWVPTIGLSDGIIDSLYTKNQEKKKK